MSCGLSLQGPFDCAGCGHAADNHAMPIDYDTPLPCRVAGCGCGGLTLADRWAPGGVLTATQVAGLLMAILTRTPISAPSVQRATSTAGEESAR